MSMRTRQTADVVILGIWLKPSRNSWLPIARPLLEKIIVDPSNPFAPDGKGGFTKIIPAYQSSGQIIARLLPKVLNS